MQLSAKQLTRTLVDALAGKSDRQVEKGVQEMLDYLQSIGQLPLAKQVLRQIDGVWKEKFGAANIRVESANELKSSTRKLLEQKAQGASITCTVNKDLIGGARVRVDDDIIDGSLLGALHNLKRTLNG